MFAVIKLVTEFDGSDGHANREWLWRVLLSIFAERCCVKPFKVICNGSVSLLET